MDVRDIRIGLNLVSGVGSILSSRLIDRFHTPDNIISASMEDFLGIKGIGERVAIKLASFKWINEIEIEKRRAEKLGAEILHIDDVRYPALLKNIYDPPPILYIIGDLPKDDFLKVAVVGSRTPSQYGKSIAAKFSRELAGSGVITVSGFARGVDSIVHSSTLDAGGRTIAVFGAGIDVVYPGENKNLYNRIIKNGALVSEFSIGSRPERANFPRRNRIISGLSNGVLVIEAGEKSGSLITAESALEQGREVFAVPGSISSPRSIGTNRLIKNGAILAEDIKDITDEFHLKYKLRPCRNESKNNIVDLKELSEDEERVFSLLTEKETHIDGITVSLQLPAGKVASILLKLELLGIVRHKSGQFYEKIFF